MYLLSIQNLHDSVRTTQTYKRLVEDGARGDILIDKCNLLLHFIIRKSLNNRKGEFEAVRLSKELLNKQIGNGTKLGQIKSILSELDVLDINHSYSASAYSKAYAIKQEWLDKGIKEVGVLRPETERRMLKHLKEVHEKNQPKYGNIYNSINELRFDTEEAIALFNTKDYTAQQIRFYDLSWSLLERLNSNDIKSEPAYFFKESQHGRLYHAHTTIPKILRRCLYTDEPLVEIDMTSALPTLLALKIDNDKNLKRAILRGEFYKSIADFALFQGDTELFNLYRRDYSEFKYKVLKNLFDKKRNNSIQHYLRELYTPFMSKIDALKDTNGYEYVAQYAQGLEAELFIEPLITETKFAVPIHDSWLVKVSDKEYFLNLLQTRLKDLYGVSGDLFKVVTR